MKICIFIGEEMEFENMQKHRTYGIAISYWKRMVAPWWHAGVRFSLMLGRIRPMVRLSTYACPRCDMGGTVFKCKPSTCVLPPHFD